MAQTLALHTRGFRIGPPDFSRLDFTRISAEAGAIAINGVALLLLLAPMSMHVPSVEQPETYVPALPLLPKRPPPLPLPPKPVEVRPRVVPTTPAVVPQKDEVQPVPIVDPLPGDEPADPGQVAKVEPGVGNTITEPLVGAHLEYEIAPPPPYPVEAIRNSLTGTVVLRVLVDIDGKPIDVRIERSSGHRVLDAAARKQVLAKWRFRPAMQGGRTVQAIGLIPVDFHLDR
ncbi:energy transducer TonB [Lysobacter niabensis]|uniref:energy transducer TonB n=1 Tax=Agrilutibacter niabensis TaxID=380628 RepID=UPI003605BCBB